MIAKWIHRISGRARFKGETVQKIKIAIVVAVVSLLIHATPAHDWFINLSYDVLTRFHSADHQDEAIVVLMDQASSAVFHQKPENAWDRSLHADLVNRLKGAGAKGIFFDVWFDAVDENDLKAQKADKRLYDALRSCSSSNTLVVLAGYYDRLSKQGSPPQGRYSTPESTAFPSGYPLRIGTKNETCRRLDASPDSFVAAALRQIPRPGPYPSAKLWISYYAASNTIDRANLGIRTLNYHQAMNPAFAQYFRGRYVFIGVASQLTTQGEDVRDLHPTPLTFAQGVTIQATQFLNLLRNDYITETPEWAQVGMLVCSAFALSFLCLGFDFTGLLLAACLSFLGTLLFTWGLLAWGAYLFPWALIGLLQIPFVVASGGFTAISNVLERSSKDHDVQTARPVTPATNPQLIPEYTMIRRIGRGGFGEVWLARMITGHFAAVKIVELSHFQGEVKAYEREFEGLRRFHPFSHKHKGWVNILHVGRNDIAGFFYYVMELGDDQESRKKFEPSLIESYKPRTLLSDLRQLKNEAGEQQFLPLNECASIGMALAEALNALHQAGLVHRDIKPSNIIFVQGAPKFADIGLVTDVDRSSNTGSMPGTFDYMPREGSGTIQADIYSLGLVIFEMVTRRSPKFFSEDMSDFSGRQDFQKSRLLMPVICKACALIPENRYQTAAELCAALEAFATILENKDTLEFQKTPEIQSDAGKG